MEKPVFPSVSWLCGNCKWVMSPDDDYNTFVPRQLVMFCTNPDCKERGVRLKVKPLMAEVVDY